MLKALIRSPRNLCTPIDHFAVEAYSSAMTLHLTPALEQRLDHLAAHTHRDSDELAQEGIERYLTHREGMERSVEEGRIAARQGDLLDHDEAMAMMDEVLVHG